MAEPARFISPKRLREPVPDDTYDSDEYLLSDDYESSSSCSSAVSSEADETDRGSNSSMDMSDSNDPSLLTAKDGTKWKEFLPVDIPRPGFSPKLLITFQKSLQGVTIVKQIGNVTFLHSFSIFISSRYFFYILKVVQ